MPKEEKSVEAQSVDSELEELLQGIDVPAAAPEEGEEDPVEEEVEDDAVVEEPAKEEEDETEVEPDPDEKEDEPSEPEEEDDSEEEDDDIPLPEDLATAYKGLIKQLNEPGFGQQPPAGEPKPEDTAEPQKKQEPAPAPTPTPVARPAATSQELEDLIKSADTDEFAENPEAFRTFMGKFAQLHGQQVAAQTMERSMQSIPEVVTRYVAHHVSMVKAAENFYQENSDLAHVKPFVGQLATNIAAKHPDWSVEDVFKETATNARKVLGLQKAAVRKASKVKAPRPKTKSAQRGAKKPDLNPLQAEIEDMLKVTGG